MSNNLPPGYDAYQRLKFLHEVGFTAEQERQQKQRLAVDTKRRRANLKAWRGRKGK